MGVLGLTPFLIRHSPQVIKRHSKRLQCFAGKTIVLDGTLLTHRFHFAPLAHRHRHIYGWYKLITELRDCGVNAICVFDGATRSVAKASEVLKRKLAREMSASRAALEFARQRRLATLTNSLRIFISLPFHDRILVSESFKRAQELSAISECRIPVEGEMPGQVVNHGLPDDFDGYFYREDVDHSHQLVPQSIPNHELDFVDHRVGRSPVVDETLIKSTPSSLIEELVTLHQAFNASSRIIEKNASSGPVELDRAPEEVKESKNQLALTQEEARIWDEIYTAFAHPDEAQTTMALAELTQRSEALAEAYARRSKPPPPECYAESRMIIEALGIPCIESTAPYEAEGLASSLVRHGRAHFVASEDTDVLVYGAPLLRNITSRQEPLTSISPSEVRASLKLSRAAFLDFCLLLGTDFTSRLRNVGPVRALSMISRHSRIERLLKNEVRHRPDDLRKYLEEVTQARAVFTRLAPVPRRERLEIKQVDDFKVSCLLRRFSLPHLISGNDWTLETSPAGEYYGEYSSYGEDSADAYPYKLY